MAGIIVSDGGRRVRGTVEGDKISQVFDFRATGQIDEGCFNGAAGGADISSGLIAYDVRSDSPLSRGTIEALLTLEYRG